MTQEWFALDTSAVRAELRALRSWKRQQEEAPPYVFTSMRAGPMTIRTIHYVVAVAGKRAGIEFPAHPHMIRLPSRKRRPGHKGNSALPRSQEYPAYRSVY